MEHPCRAFRIEWLDGERSSRRAIECEECAHWVELAERMFTGFAGMGRLSAPPELERRVAAELAGDHSRRLIGVLNSLVRHSAPPALDQRVEELLAGAEERGSRKAQALRSLDVRPAPNVLERLLEEELADPERHRIERFSGSLKRMRAPESLADRVGSRVHRRVLTRIVVAPLVTLAAASLVVWIAVRQPESEPDLYSFQVIQASSLESLDPMARALAESLGGGFTGGLR